MVIAEDHDDEEEEEEEEEEEKEEEVRCTTLFWSAYNNALSKAW